MAKQESEREDLLREATALIERIEFRLPDVEQPLVFGFRRGGSASVYVGDEPVFQFNTLGELRRAFWQGEMLKAERGQLVALSRRRLNDSVELVRRGLPAAEAAQLLQECRSWLNRVRNAIKLSQVTVIGQIPAHADVLNHLSNWLQALPAELRIAERPNVA